MRFPSLFRLPRHQQYEIKPRYYDPVKEEIKERERRIKEQMKTDGDHAYEAPNRITFSRRKRKSASSTSLVQLGIAVMLCVLIFGWLQFGNDVLQIYLVVMIAAYLLYKVRRLQKKRTR
ncbi:MAG: hypothetical protein AAF789_08295 [Bacteroidota bacterium]